MRGEIRPLKDATRRIAPRSTTSVSLVASDGGNNALKFDPFLIQLVRVVDSYGRELCLDAVTPTTNVVELSERQLAEHTALGFMMEELGVRKLYELSTMIPDPRKLIDDTTVKPSWVLVYRDLCEWAVLFDRIVRSEFATDTLVIRDGLLRSKLFAGELFIQMMAQLRSAIEEKAKKQRRKIYLNEFQSIPMHGQFLLVQLAHEDEGVLGRITSFFSDGKLTSSTGEDYGLRAVAEDRPVPEDCANST